MSSFLGDMDFSFPGTTQPTRPRGRPRRSEEVRPAARAARAEIDRRDDEIAAAYVDGLRGQALADKYGLTRERICQILRRSNVISHLAERRRLAREGLAEEVAAIKAAAKTALDQQIEAAVALVRDGASHRQAAAAVGFRTNSGSRLLSIRCRELGLPLRHSRWKDLSERERRVHELHAQGITKTATIRKIQAEGDETINLMWITHRMAHLSWPRGNNHRPLAAPAKPQPTSPEPWTEDRVTQLRDLWFRGASAQQIADIFGPPFTRNAVIGKISRLRTAGRLSA